MAKTFRLILVTLALLSSAAQADLLLEPYVGYHLGKYTAFNNDTDNVNGPTFGGRIGYSNFTGLMLGVDLMSGVWKNDDSPAGDVTPTQAGLFVGFEFPILLRAYAAYSLFVNELKTASGSSTTKASDGSTIKLGLGFTALPLLSINLEYLASTYKKQDGATQSTTMTSSMYGVTLSVPLEL
jgi:hypothetical protein